MYSDEFTYPNACLAFILLMLLFTPPSRILMFPPVAISLHVGNFNHRMLTFRLRSATKNYADVENLLKSC